MEQNSRIIAIIGCGRMGSLLADKLSRHYQLYVYDQLPENAERLSRSCGALIAGKDDLKKAEIIILALATEVIPKAIAELEEYLTEEAILVNIATTFPHCEVNTKLKKVSAKIVGHAKEMALGEKPVIIVESDNLEARTIIKEVFLHIGSVLEGQTDIVSKINTISSKYGILAALEVKNALQELNLSEEIITAAIRNVTAGTMKAFAIGDVGPFAQAIIDKYEKGGHV